MVAPVNSVGLPPSLWRNHAFVRLWLAQVISNAGTAITGLALPLTAVLLLNATTNQMALLNIASFAPHIVFGLFAGVWVDRARRQPILLGADLGRALLLVTIPLAALLGAVTLPHLWLVAFAVSTLTVFSSLASITLLPAIVPQRQLVEANSRLAVTDAILTITAPTVAGGLIQLVSAPKAILADAISYLGSALTLRGLRANETAAPRRTGRGVVWREIAEGAHELLRTPALRALTLSVCVGTFGTAMQGTVSLIFVVRELAFSPALLGVIGAFGGGGALIGAAAAGRVTRRLGVGPTLIGGNLLWALGATVAPFVPRGGAAILVIGAGSALASFGSALWSVSQMSLRQAITPSRLFARATAARRLPMFAMQIAGAALGGALGPAIGLRATLLLGALGLVVGCLLLFLSPVRAIHDLTSEMPAGV
jgi:MFS family permease